MAPELAEDLVPDHADKLIALMHPGVGMALADWLQSTANSLDIGLEYCSTHGDDHPCRCLWEPLAVAEAILGGAQ